MEPSPCLDGQLYPIDIVAVKPDHLVVIETALSLTGRILDQTNRWVRRYANQVWAAVREPKTKSPAHLRRIRALECHGIGLFYVTHRQTVSTQLRADEYAEADTDLIRSSLTPSQLNGPPAGSAGVKRHRPDKWDPVRRLLSTFPDMTGKEIQTEFVWSPSVRIEFVREGRAGRIPGIKGDRSTPTRFRVEAQP